MTVRGLVSLGIVWSALAVFSHDSSAQTVFSGGGIAAATIARDSFRAVLGGETTAGANGSFGGLRREINWDGVPAAQAAPNNLAADFFNSISPRGVVLSTPGIGFQVSGATTDDGAGQPAAANFGNIDPSYPNTFATFSAQRLFTPLGSSVTDVTFFVPGTSQPAAVRGFGAIFTDVDVTNISSIQYFDANNQLLGLFFVPTGSGNQTISFLGVLFNTEVVTHVRIIAGNAPLAGGNTDTGSRDVVAMDDFIYSEPVPAIIVFAGAGATAASAAHDNFRDAIGGGTAVGADGSFGGVRREIDWDGLPSAQCAPNFLDPNFFNSQSQRGVVFSTPGTGFQVSGGSTDGGTGQPAPANFGNIDPSYTSTFLPFSPQRLFTEIGSNTVTVSFFLPGTSTPAVVRSFGAIFTDVDAANITSIEYFDAVGRSLAKFFVPAMTGNQTISFLGAVFPAPIVRFVRLTTGNAPLALGTPDGAGGADVVTMDDFIYSEPAGAPVRLLNMSSRARVLTGDQVLIDGFIISGTQNKSILLRGIGPSLAGNGVSGALQNPVIELHNATTMLKFNDNWKFDDFSGLSQEAFVQATGLAPTDDRESVLSALLNPGFYTVVLRGKNNTTGIGVLEIYDLAPSNEVSPPNSSALANISGRALVDTGDNVLIGGFINGAGGGTPAHIVVRGIGPSLTSSGVPNALQDPTLELFNGDGTLVASNDNWRDTQQAEIQSTGLTPSDDRESALVETLPAGAYTAIVRGKDNTSGIGLVEIYKIQ